jgi:riboflavin biosynthesis pyrimidine reductase
MANLFMMDFPVEQVKIKNCYTDDAVLNMIKAESLETVTPPKIKEIYGEIMFPMAPEDRPYTFCSVVLSSDGKMAFQDNPAGPLIAKNNYFDPNGALADFWVLNALRTYADGIIIGGKTLQSEIHATSHIFDPVLFEQRKTYLNKKEHPWNIIVSFDATDIPFEHMIFDIEEEDFHVAMATSPAGKAYIEKNCSREVLFIEVQDDKMVNIQHLQKQMNNMENKIPVFITGEGNCPDAMKLMYLLRRLGFMRLLIESPSYNWYLMQQNALDEYFINYSMLYAGGGITPGLPAPFTHTEHPHAKLLSLGIHQSSFIMTRQKLYYGVEHQVDMTQYKY